MKTIVCISKFLAIPFLMAALFVGCGKSNDNSVANNPTYGIQNGTCYNQQNNTQVQPYLCQNTGNGYTSTANGCYSIATGRQVDFSFCSGSGYGANGAQQCYGTYLYQGQPVQCYGSNCRGYILTTTQASQNSQAGQQVNCQ